jgi:putative ABC transport system substrate-binding protein
MRKTFRLRFAASRSNNRKSKIKNLKWLGLSLIAFVLVAAVVVVDAQQQVKVPRIGILTLGVASAAPTFEAFRQGLRELGYIEGKDILIEYRYAEGKTDRLSNLAAELVRLKVDIIVTESGRAAEAAKHATQTTPIVMAIVGDPVGIGLVASLARPGGNVTGLTVLAPELSGKRLELLKEAAPKTTSVAVIWNAANPSAAGFLQETKATAKSLGLQLQPVEVRRQDDLDAAFKAVTSARPSAFITLADGMLLGNRTRIVEFTAKNRLPAIFPDGEFADAGGLMAYGPNLGSNFRRAAIYVDKILKGAKPADLPVEQPTKFELVINQKTAQQIGLTIPPNVLARADRVIK